METDDIESEMVRFFGRHLVPIHFEMRHPQKTSHLFVTAFVLAVNEHWFLVTAGHCLQKIDEALKEGWVVACSHLAPDVARRKRDLISFLYRQADTVWECEEGAYDYGFIPLSGYYQKLLAAVGVVPLNEEVWDKQPVSAEFHMLLGVPEQMVVEDMNSVQYGLAMCPVEIADSKPAGFEDSGFPTFYGRLRLEDDEFKIDGMSGGPILAFKHDASGELRYWVVALQSSWLPKSRYIRAYPTKILGSFLNRTTASRNGSSVESSCLE